MRTFKTCFTLLCIIISVSFCKPHKDDVVSPTIPSDPSSGSLYLLGFYGTNASTTVPAYWKDGNITQLSRLHGSAVGIAKDGNDVYVVGVTLADVAANNQIVVWKNGVPTALTTGNTLALVSDIAVSSNHDVYVVGGESDNSGIFYAKYWKNGVATILNNTSRESEAFRVVISGSDVYIAGYTQPSGQVAQATIWKNGIATVFPGQNYAYANDIVVAGDDIYVAGSDNDAKYWKNGVSIPLTISGGGSSATCLALAGGDVYVAGDEYSTGSYARATYWKNGTQENILTDGSQSVAINSIGVIGQDVYLGGNVGNGSYLWKNGALVSPFNGSDNTFGIVKIRVVN